MRGCGLCRWGVAVILLLASAGTQIASFAEDPPPTAEAPAAAESPKSLPPEQLKQRDALDEETNRAFAEGRIVEAINAAQKMLAIERKGLGSDHEEVDNSLQWLAELYAIAGDVDGAGKLAAESLSTQRRIHGDKHWRTNLAQAHADFVDKLSGVDSATRDAIKQAAIDYRLAFRLYRQRKAPQASAPAQKSLDARRKALGNDSYWTGRSLLIVGYVQQELKKSTEAASSLGEAAKIFEKTVGSQSPDLANALEGLAGVQQTLEQFEAATKSIRQVWTIRKEVYGPKNSETLNALGTLVYYQIQNAARAEERDDLPVALKAREELLTLQQQRHAEDDWRVADARFALERHKQIAALKPDQRKKLAAALTQQNKSFALYQQSKSAEGLPPAEQSVDTRKQILGAEHADTAAAMNVVGLLADDLKDYAKAEAMLGQATELWRKARGENHPDYARGLFNLGCAHEHQGHWAEAAKLLRQSLAIREACYGPQDSDTLAVLNHLAYVRESAAGQLQNAGDFADAKKAWAEAVELYARRYGKDHWRTANVRLSAQTTDQIAKLTEDQRKKLQEANDQLNSVMQLTQQQKHGEALPLAGKAYVTRQALLGAEHRDTINALSWVGEMHLRMGNYPQAEKMLKDVETQRKKLFGEAHPTYLNSLDDLGRMYFLQGNTSESAKYLRRVLATRRKEFGDNDPETQRSVNWLLENLKKWADNLNAKGNYAGAIDVRREMLELNKEHRGPDNWQTRDVEYKIKIDTSLGKLSKDDLQRLREAHERLKECEQLTNQNKNLEALAKAQEASQLFQELLGEGNLDSIVANNWLAQLYQRQGDTRTADKLLQRNQEIVAAELGKQHPDYAYTLHNLANSLYSKNDFAKACPLYRESWQIRRDSQGEKHADTANSSTALQNCLDRLAAGQEKKADFAGAKKSRQEKLTLLTELYGDKHWQVTDARWAAYQTDMLATMRPYQREQLAEADKLIYNSQYWSQQRAEQAKGYNADPQKLLGFSNAILKAAGQALQIRQQILANVKNHPAIAEALDLLAEAQSQTGDFVNAKNNLEKSLAIRKATQGDKHPNYLKTNENLTAAVTDSMAVAFQPPSKLTPAQQQRVAQRDRLWEESLQHRKNGDTESEEYVLQQVLDVERAMYGDAHEEMIGTYLRLMWISVGQLDGDSAHEYASRMQQIQVKLHGADSWQAKEARHTLATVDRCRQFDETQWQKFAQVAKRSQQPVQVFRAVQGGDENKFREDFEKARQIVEYNRTTLRELFGENHLYYANALDGLTTVYPDQQESLRRQAAEITARVLGNDHPIYQLRLNEIARDYAMAAKELERQGKYVDAKQIWEKRVGIQLLHFGPQHWQVTKARGHVRRCEKLAKLSKEDAGRFRQAEPDAYFDEPPAIAGQPVVDEATKIRRRAEVCRELVGPESFESIQLLHKLGVEYRNNRNHRAAIEAMLPAIAAGQKYWGRENPVCISLCSELGLAYYAVGDYVNAESYFRQCREALESSGHTNEDRYANCLNNLAILYQALGDFDRAEPLLKQIVNINIQPPEWPVDVDPEFDLEKIATGKYQTLMGEFNLTVVLVNNTVSQPPPPQLMPKEIASFVNNLGLLHLARHDYRQAETLLRQALSFYNKRDNGERPEEYFDGLCNLASVYEGLGELERADSLLESVVQQKRKRTYKDAKFAVVLHNLATIRFRRGDLERAGELWREAASIRVQELGERHPNTIMSQASLALLADRNGQVDAAVAGLGKALDQTNINLQLAATIQSERQQLIMANTLRGYLDQYLSLAARRQLPATDAYRHVLMWKGAVLARQRWIRSVQQKLGEGGKDAGAGKDLLAELAKINNRLSSSTFGGLGYDDRQKPKELDELSVRKDELERQLSRQSAELGAQLQAVKLAPAELAAMLPARTALVDFVEYEHTTWPAEGASAINRERRVAAFVVLPGKPVERRDLGPATEIEKLVEACREQWLKRKRPTEADPAVELRKILWDPLAPLLADVDTVLVSPDGATARIPFAALPNTEPDSYLIDKWAIAIVPVPQLLGDLLKKPEAPAAPATPTMLLVGDVDFGAEPGGSPQSSRSAKTPRGNKPATFFELPGTRTEIDALQKIFLGKFKTKGVKLLDGSRATESEVRRQASECGFLHLATHGFFAPPEVKPAATLEGNPYSDSRSTGEVAGWNPGLLSGIVLAGVNQPVSADRDDGILTAAEVSELNLSQTQLVVLSACETGLGQIAGGEGALGLQRAFQVAGARSVVSSLWKVDDEATQLLMTEFYGNLWKKGLSPLAAFRQAQLSLLNAKVDVSKLRGFDVDEDAPAEQKSKRLSPRLWAAFVLSGSPN